MNPGDEPRFLLRSRNRYVEWSFFERDVVMTWSPEMEIIDQLCGGDMTLRAIAGLFADENHARRVLGTYIDRGILVLLRASTQLPKWEAAQMLRSGEPLAVDVMVSLTEAGAKKFDSGDWGRH